MGNENLEEEEEGCDALRGYARLKTLSSLSLAEPTAVTVRSHRLLREERVSRAAPW